MTAKRQKKADDQAKPGRFEFLVHDGHGGLREATHRDLCIAEIGFEYAANGLPFTPEERARAAACYDAAAEIAREDPANFENTIKQGTERQGTE